MMIAWILLFVSFAVYKLINAPKICWEPGINPVTKELMPGGGCQLEYGQAIMQMILPFIVWLIIFVILLLFYLKSKK